MRHCDEVKVQPQWLSRLSHAAAGRRRGPGKSTVADVVSEIEQLLGCKVQGVTADGSCVQTLRALGGCTGFVMKVKPGSQVPDALSVRENDPDCSQWKGDKDEGVEAHGVLKHMPLLV